MKFKFEGIDEIIEINFDFMETSELIQALEPDDTTIFIHEVFSRYQIDLFKKILEKITNREEITKSDKNIVNSDVLEPLIEYFKFNYNFMKHFKNYFYILHESIKHLRHVYGEIKYFESVDDTIKYIIQFIKNKKNTYNYDLSETHEDDTYKKPFTDFLDFLESFNINNFKDSETIQFSNKDIYFRFSVETGTTNIFKIEIYSRKGYINITSIFQLEKKEFEFR